MQLVYLNESGSTGLDLNNAEQPIFALCAMIIAEDKWHTRGLPYTRRLA